MSDFKNYYSNKNKNTTPKEEDTQAQLEYLRNIASSYDGKSEDKLIADIIKAVISQKEQGKLTNDEIKKLYKTISPMLNQEQRTRLEGLMEQLLKL